MSASAAIGTRPTSDYTPRNDAARRRTSARIDSIDLVRGVVMLLMAIDHVRVYAGVPAGGPAPGVFFTRWITNFVAPAFVFLAGTSIYLHGAKLGSRAALARFLAVRGLWLVLLELTVIRVSWTFNLDFAHYMLAGVIWVIGVSMLVMSALVFLPTAVVGGLGVAIIALHNLTDFVPGLGEQVGSARAAWLWQLLYFGGEVKLGANGPPLVVLYVLIPWIGVMAAGYGFGAVMQLPPERRRRIVLRLGLGAIAAFVALRALDAYGDPRHWHAAPAQMPAFFAFLNTTKYPASLLFLLMTLGPLFVALPLVEGARGRLSRVLVTFGRVPLFYYLLHIPVIHLTACIVSVIQRGYVDPWLFTNHPVYNPPAPPGYRWSLALLYVVWLVCIAALYFPSRWYGARKARDRSGWLSYL